MNTNAKVKNNYVVLDNIFCFKFEFILNSDLL